MGAAWVVENEHAIVFTPNFKLDSYEFQSGALDPREIGFYINNLDRLTEFIESLRPQFDIHQNPVLVNQKIREFLKKIEPFQGKIEDSNSSVNIMETLASSVINVIDFTKTVRNEMQISDKARTDSVERFFADLMNDKLKDEVVLLLHYIIDRYKYKLGTGWQESSEIDHIKVWEELQELNSTLSRNYQTVLRMLEMRKLTVVTEKTSHGNPKEVSLIEEMQEILLEIPTDISKKISEIVAKNYQERFPF